MTARTILVIEDEELLLEAIKAKLEKDGFRVVGARAVDQGLDYLSTLGSIDAIWLDHYLPDKLGIELLKAVRGTPTWSRIPVFLVTNSIDSEVINQYMKYGLSQYYVKMLTKMETIITRIELELQQISAIR